MYNKLQTCFILRGAAPKQMRMVKRFGRARQALCKYEDGQSACWFGLAASSGQVIKMYALFASLGTRYYAVFLGMRA